MWPMATKNGANGDPLAPMAMDLMVPMVIAIGAHCHNLNLTMAPLNGDFPAGSPYGDYGDNGAINANGDSSEAIHWRQ